MIADALKVEIEAHAARVRASNPLVAGAAAGTLAPDAVARYLASLLYIVGSTPGCLARARDRAVADGRDALASYFSRKLGEESGHDAWAEGDIRALGRSRVGAAAATAHATPVPAVRELIAYLERVIDRDPLMYLPYMLWAEYLTVLLGGELVSAMVDRCAIPRDAMTCVAKHAELDKDHSDDDLDAIDLLATDPRMLKPMRDVLHTSMRFFDRACEQMVFPAEAARDREYRAAG